MAIGLLRITLAVACLGAVVCSVSLSSEEGDPRPGAEGADSAKQFVERLQPIEPLVSEAILQRQLPGAVVAIGFAGKLQYLKAFGNRQLQPHIEPMTIDTLFDLASLTKPLVTACGVMKLLETNEVSLDDAVAKHLPEFAATGKEAITVKQLLLHTSGLIADNPMSDYAGDREAILNKIMRLPLSYPTGTRFRYSDVGFIVLGRLIEKKSNLSLQEFSQEHFFEPLHMTETSYLPPESLWPRTAPTELRNGAWIKGQVHDPRAFAMGGMAGHAGLFSTASDLAIFAQMLLDQGSVQGRPILTLESVESMSASYEVPGGVRGLGWDKKSAYSANRGTSMSPSAFGHGGFTGTGIWIDPELKLYVIFLSNRLHLSGKTEVNRLIGQIGTHAANAARAGLSLPPSASDASL